MDRFWYFLTEVLDFLPCLYLLFFPFKDDLRLPFKQVMVISYGLETLHALGFVLLSYASFYSLDFMLAYRLSQLAMGLIFLLAFVQRQKCKALFVYSLMLPFVSLILVLAVLVMPMVPFTGPLYMKSSLLRLLFTILFFYPFYKLEKSCFGITAPPVSDQFWNVAWVAPAMLSIISGLFMSNNFEIVGIDGRRATGRILLFACAISCSYFMLLVNRYTEKEAEIKKKAQQDRFLLELQTQQYASWQHNLNLASKTRHDLRHHMLAIQLLTENGEYDALKTYLNNLVGHLEQQKVAVPFCDSAAANAILVHYIDKAQARSITTDVKLALPQDVKISDEDLSVLLGNSLENALEACAYVPKEKRFLHVTGRERMGKFYMIVENSFDGVAHPDGLAYASRKKDFAADGIGILSIRNIAEKYKGAVEITALGNKFTLSLMLEI